MLVGAATSQSLSQCDHSEISRNSIRTLAELSASHDVSTKKQCRMVNESCLR
jgi:hypothetical protein